MVALEIYRSSAVVKSLTETVDEMVHSGAITRELADRVLLQFDESMSAALDQQVTSRASFKGHLHSYRKCDSIWTFNLRDVTFRNAEISEEISKLRIVAYSTHLARP